MTFLNKIPFSLLSLLLLCFSSFTALSDRIMGRNAFFLAISLMIFISLIQKKKVTINKENKLLTIAIILMGLSQGIWAFFYGHEGDNIFLANENYGIVSRYLLVIGLSLLFINNLKTNKIININKELLTVFFFAGFLYMCAVGLVYCYENPGERLRINSAATISGYIITLQGLFTLYLVDILNSKLKKLFLPIIIAVSLITLALTETRSAILVFPALVVLYFLTTRAYARKKILTVALLFIISAPFAIKIFFPSTLDRLNSSYTEVADIGVDNDSSIGARVSMWKAGIYAFEQHPLGQSAATRYKEVSYYIDKAESGNPEAKRNSIYHLHSDLIESLSLRGILGGFIYILLIISIIYSAFKQGMLVDSLILFLLPILLYGSVDTLFIDKRFVIVFGAQLLLYQLFPRKASGFQEVKTVTVAKKVS
ncbi:O-antigen ligase family protein [Rosenbergiella australiborealis]|nr:O-antigen ligase family protein [Rosenbergiella australiborealis]